MVEFADIKSVGGGESPANLDDLPVSEIEPVIATVLRSKLRVSMRPDDFSQRNQDALEIAGDVRLQIIAEFRRRTTGNGGKIENLQAYAHTTALNAYRQYVWEQHPERRRLKSRLRYLLGQHPAFGLWNANGVLRCGRSGQEAAARIGIDELQLAVAHRSDAEGLDDRHRIIELVDSVFAIAEGSITFSELLHIVAAVQGVTEPSEVDPDELPEPEIESRVVEKLEFRESLGLVWHLILELPREHRIALLMNLRDHGGECALSLLPVLGVASIRRIAEAVGIDPQEFARIWNELPWNDMKIAEYLGLSRQQVINLRQTARLRLARLCK